MSASPEISTLRETRSYGSGSVLSKPKPLIEKDLLVFVLLHAAIQFTLKRGAETVCRLMRCN
jgi:hypothetical protein